MAEEIIKTTPEGAAPPADEGAKEQLNAFQKFMKTLIGGEKEDPAKETPPAEGGEGKETKPNLTAKSYSEDELATALAAEKQKWQDEQKEKERIARLSPEEREKAEKYSTDKKIADLEQKLLQKDLREEAVAALSKDGYPVGLAEPVEYGHRKRGGKGFVKGAHMMSISLNKINNRLPGYLKNWIQNFITTHDL